MNIQIFGAKKCFDTQKTERYFKERKVKYQYVDVHKFGLSKGEFESVKGVVGLAGMIDAGCKEYVTLNMDKIRTECVRAETLFNNPKLYLTPIVRNGKNATVGFVPEVWKEWEVDEK